MRPTIVKLEPGRELRWLGHPRHPRPVRRRAWLSRRAGGCRPLPLRAVRDVYRPAGRAHHVDGRRGDAPGLRGDEPGAQDARGKHLTRRSGFVVFFVAGQGYLVPAAAFLADAGAVIAGTMLACTAWRRLARGLLWGAIAAFLMCGLSPLGDVLIRPLEQRFPRVELERPGAPITGIIVLGGAEDSRAADTPQLAALNEAAERYTEAVVLARRLAAARLVFSGGSGALLRRAAGSRGGRPPVRGAGDSQGQDQAGNEVPRHLRERAFYGAPARSAPRAAVAARHLGLAHAARHGLLSPCRVRGGGLAGGLSRAAPPQSDAWNHSISEGLRRIDIVAREYVGLVAYYWRPDDTLFPAP